MPAPTPSEPLWRLCRPAALHIREWDDGGVVYDAVSGDTHLLDLFGLELLVMLAGTARGGAGLAAELAEVLPVDPDGLDALTLVEAKLHQLERLGLVAAAP